MLTNFQQKRLINTNLFDIFCLIRLQTQTQVYSTSSTSCSSSSHSCENPSEPAFRHVSRHATGFHVWRVEVSHTLYLEPCGNVRHREHFLQPLPLGLVRACLAYPN